MTAGNVVSRYYDSLLSKVISSAPTFEKAVQRMARALQEFQVSSRAHTHTGGKRAESRVLSRQRQQVEASVLTGAQYAPVGLLC